VASSAIVPLGGARFAAVGRMTARTMGDKDAESGSQAGEYALVLVVVEPDGAAWKVAQQLRVFDFAVKDPCQSSTVPTRVTPGDFDHDSRPEIELRIRASSSERAVGCVARSHLVLVDLHPAPRILLVDSLDAKGVYVTTSVLRYEDLDGDGFPDLSITETTRRTGPGETDTKYDPAKRRYLYDPASDCYRSGGKLIRPKTPTFFKDANDPDWRDPNFR
jgi:hypothetical protein